MLSLIVLCSSPLLAQVDWTFDHSTEVLTVAADGGIQTGGDSLAFTLGTGGNVSIASVGVSYIVSEGLDVMVSRSSITDSSFFRVLTKRPASLSAADLAGSWVYKEFEIVEDAGGLDIHGFATFSSNATISSAGSLSFSGGSTGNFTIDTNKHMNLSIDGEVLNFGVNAAKDLMFSVSTSETGLHVLRIITRPESGGTTPQLAGSWTIRDFGVDTTPGAYDFWYDSDDIIVTPSGNFSTPDGPATVTANGNGEVAFSDGEYTADLDWNQSRNLLVNAESAAIEHSMTLVVKRPTSLTLAQLAGTWDLYQIQINTVPDPGGSGEDQVVTTYHPDGTTLAIRETWVGDKLHGEPAYERWNELGNSTLTENYTHGNLTESTTIDYTADGIGLYSTWYHSHNPDGSPISDILTFYHPDGTTVSEITTTTYPEEGTKIRIEKFREDGIKSRDTTRINGKRDGTASYWNSDGTLSHIQNHLHGILLIDTRIYYHPNGTVRSEETTTYTGGIARSNTKRWTDSGILTIDFNTVNVSWEGLYLIFDDLGNPISEKTYSKGQLNGPAKTWYPNSTQLQSEGGYLINELDGLWTYWHANGEIRDTINYDNGLHHGNSSTYDEQGHLISSKTFEYGELRHRERWIYYVSGTLSDYSEEHSETRGLVDDYSGYVIPDWEISKRWDENGNLASEIEYINGKQDGVWRTYQDGVLASESYYSQDLLHGLRKYYSIENGGALSSQRNYHFGKLDGETLFYNLANGILIERSNYKDDKLHGLQEFFNADNGNPTSSGTYENGLKTGLHTTWNTDGSIISSEITYQDDKYNGSYRTYYSSGVLSNSGNYTNGLKNGTFSSYNSEGELLSTVQYLAGFKDGLQENYTTTYNKVTQRFHYRGGSLHGLYETYNYGDGYYYLANSTHYEDDLQIGPHITYYPSGNVKVYTPIILGRVEGVVIVYSDGGGALTKTTYKGGIRHGSYKTYSLGKITLSAQYSHDIRCGTWTLYSYDSEGNVTSATTDHGTCPEVDFDLRRGIQGVITADGAPVSNAYISGFHTGAGSDTEGFYRTPLSSEGGTSFTVTVTHIDHATKEFSVTIPEENGLVTRNFSLDPYDNPSLILEEPSVTGIHFLKDISLPLTIPGTVDWGDALSGILKRTHGEFSEEKIQSYDTFTLSINPGLDSEVIESRGTLEAVLSGGETSNSVPLPDFKVVPQPNWTSSIGSWRAETTSTSGDPGTYYLQNAWPNTPLNVGIEESMFDGTGIWTLWELVPVVGGNDLGLFDIQFKVDAMVPTNDNGSVIFGGQGELRFASHTVRIEGDGEGTLQWSNTRLDMSEASIHLKGIESWSGGGKAVDIIPALKNAKDIPYVGKLINLLTADLEIKLENSISVGGRFPIDTTGGDILFAPTSMELALTMGAVFNVPNVSISNEGSAKGLWSTQSGELVYQSFNVNNKAEITLSWKDFEIYSGDSTVKFTHTPIPSLSAKMMDTVTRPFNYTPALMKDDFLSLSRYSEFQAALPQMQAASTDVIPEKLINNIYPHANPVLAQHNSKKALAYIHYDPSSPEGQSTQLYIMFDNGSGFESPSPLHTQARSDFNPQLAYLSDGRLIAVWETSVLDQIATSVEERISGLEIAWAIYNPNTQSWSSPTLLSNNAFYDHDPRLANSASGPMLVWQNNPNNQLVPTLASPDTIHVTTWDGSTFPTAFTLPFNPSPLGITSLAYDGTEATYVWVHDEDDDVGTEDDRELYWTQFDGSTWGTPTRITNDSIVDSTPRIFCLNGSKFELIWNKGSELVRLSSTTTLTHEALIDVPTAHFDVSCDDSGNIALLWADYTESQADLFYAVRDRNSNTWSDELILTNNDALEKQPTLIFNDLGQFTVAYLSEDLETEQSDLMILNHSLGIDLTVGTPSFSPALNNPGEFEITAQVMNLGNLSAGYVSVDFYLGDPNISGTLLKTSNITMNGGHESYIAFTTSGIHPEDNGTIYVRIDPSDTVYETNESNNTASSLLTLRELDDDDGDGIPDAWEMTHFKNVDEDGTGDSDGDSYSDLYEYLTLTDPKDPKDFFQFTLQADPEIEGNYLINFPTVSGYTYRIQYTLNMSNWIDHSFNEGTGSHQLVSASGSNENSDKKFFRIRISQD